MFGTVDEIVKLRDSYAPKLQPLAAPEPPTQDMRPIMGPYAQQAQPVQQRAGLGQVPKHHGWAKLLPHVQQRTLELMGSFPELRFTSGYRDPAHNARVGGVRNSGHTRGEKVDLVGTPQQMRDAAAWAVANGGKPLIHNSGSGLHLDISWGPG